MNEKIEQILREGKRCQKKMVYVGPTGPQGPTGPAGPSTLSSFAEMHNVTGYPLSFNTSPDIGETLPVLFDAQNIVQGNYGFEPGSITLDPYVVTPGTIIVNEPGYYEIHYDFSNVLSTIDGEYHIHVLENGSPIENGSSHVNLVADKQTTISNTVYAYLPANTRISMDVTGYEVGQFIIGGNMNQVLIKKLSN